MLTLVMPLYELPSPSWGQVEGRLKELWGSSDADVIISRADFWTQEDCPHRVFSEARSFLANVRHGMLSISLWPETEPEGYLDKCPYAVNDNDALGRDWLAVGSDLLQGIVEVRPAVKSCVNSTEKSPQPTWR